MKERKPILSDVRSGPLALPASHNSIRPRVAGRAADRCRDFPKRLSKMGKRADGGYFFERCLDWRRAQVSRKPMVRLKTRLSGFVSGSRQK